jgi:hypothetical protein
MRLLLTLVAAAVLSGCSHTNSHASSPNLTTWRAGNAVVVLSADVVGDPADVERLGHKPGVIAASSTGKSLRIAFSRQAMLVDLAALKLELEHTPGLANVREQVVPPAH